MNESSSVLPRRNLPLLLLQAREHVIAHFRPILQRAGLTEQQWRIIRLLLETGPLEPRQIGEQCRISSPSLAGVLTRLEQMELIKRSRVDRDLRRVSVSLTPRSRTLAVRLAPRIEAVYGDIEKRMGPDFCDQFYRTLDHLIKSVR